MTIHSTFLSFCLLILFCLASSKTELRAQEKDRMFLVLLEIQDPKDIAFCYTTRFDKNKAMIEYAFDDTLNYLEDFIYEEEQLFGPDCFMPEMKLIFKNYTYIISLYCTAAIKYKNSAPFTPSSVRLRNDLVFTQTVYMYLADLKDRYFGEKEMNWELVNKVITSEPLIEADPYLDDAELELYDGFEDDLFEDELDLEDDPLELLDDDLEEIDFGDEFDIMDDDLDDMQDLEDDDDGGGGR
jgi:hypothetical protein